MNFFFSNNWNCSENTNQKITINKGRRKEEEKFWKRWIYKKERIFNNDSCVWSIIYSPQEENEYNFSKLHTSHERDFGTCRNILPRVMFAQEIAR